jgi:hypothetical protein
VSASTVSGQTSWEYSPYQIQIWVALSPGPELAESLHDELARTIVEHSDIVAAAAWDVQVSKPPPRIHGDMLVALEAITVDRVAAESVDILQADKLVLLVVNSTPDGFHVQARELDCRARTWSALVERSFRQPAQITREAFAAVTAAFAPLIRVEKTKDKTAQARLRAGGLIVRQPSPALVAPGDVLQVVVRNNDRLGEPRPGGIQVLPWTYLQVVQRRLPHVECAIYSGMRSPISARGSFRTENLALRVEPLTSSTELKLVSRSEPPRPLSGYEVHAQDPGSEHSQLLGQTDWRGGLEVPRADQRLRVLYIKNGGQLLARLPMVPGFEPQQTATLIDDDLRLEAEGVLKGFQSTFMDLIARRQVMALRIRKYIADKNYAEAEKLIGELRTLDAKYDLGPQLDRQQQRFTSSDRRVQSKVDALFNDTRGLLAKYLDTRLPSQLTEELRTAQQTAAPKSPLQTAAAP